ncbi:protein phosphatase 2C domain-containing protein [Maricurvus nonylphenolicus]|uniref:PP2C family protein-serine/threonine phosphatase n=1 Tax=Maricurvus nonylphenolicus TaxID=1008307 RepID=UPI0036F3E5F1
MASLNSSSVSDKGLNRDNNEDCYLACPEQGLWGVADGMGGHEAGEIASAIVKTTLESSATGSTPLEDSILEAHENVLQAVRDGKGAAGMGSTVVALQSQGHDYKVAWVGDSRAYLWSQESNGGRLEQLTTDHSYVQMLLASGAIAEDEVANHPDKNVITQCIGSLDLQQISVDVINGEWQKQQRILLCSDGLTDEVDNQHIAQILCESRSTKEAAQKLMQAALDNGGKDNITVQVIESPLYERSMLQTISDWLPVITGKSWLDALLYATTLLCLLLVGYWILG